MLGVTQKRFETVYGSSKRPKTGKTIMSLALALALAFSSLALAACSTSSPAPTPAPPSGNSDSAPSAAPTAGSDSATPAPVPSGDSVDWQQFLEGYEAWVDDYVAFMKKYNDNPTDPTLIADYAVLLTEYAEWADKAEKVQDELTGDDLTVYLETMTRVTAKLNSVLS